MKDLNKKCIFSSILTVLLIAFSYAQTQEVDFRNVIKKRVNFDRWTPMVKGKPEVLYKPFKLDSSIVAPWKIARIRDIGAANNGKMIQYILVKNLNTKNDSEMVRISITHCANRSEAMEGLVDHLSGVQRSDYQLIEKKENILGEVVVGFAGKPETGLYFIRGNLIITVENAGKDSTLAIRNLSSSIDNFLIQLIK